MEVGEQQEDAPAAVAVEETMEKAVAMESGEEQQQGEKEMERQEGSVEKEIAVMESLPVEVEIDKVRGEREKAPDNAEERAVMQDGGLGFPTTVRGESRKIVVGLDGAGERIGSELHEVHVEGVAAAQDDGEAEAEGDAVMAGDDVETEVDMADAAAAVDEPEAEAEAEMRTPVQAKRPGVEANGSKSVQVSMKRNASAALDNTDGTPGEVVVKKPKKKTNVWSKSTTRKTSRKSKPVKIPNGEKKEECIEVNPAQRYSLEERNGIQLSKEQKAEKVELSLDKMQASSEKGYRMVRATRGVTEGAWYFEILVKDLGATGHTRLGWSTWKGDLQAPVGFDANSYAFRDVDGSKVHQAIREPYSAAYVEGDVIGFYISLPNGAEYAPKYELYVTKAPGARSVYPVPVEKDEGPPKRVPGSEVSFFKNGVCQGVAYTDIYAGEYFPAASMYTLPSPEKKCSVRFNFGPNFQFPIEEWGDRPVPLPMSQAPPPEGLAAADVEEPPPADGTNETKNKSETPNGGNGGKQRMAAERGNGAAEGRNVTIAVGSVSGSGGGVRTKRAADDKDRVKRPGLPARKIILPKGPKKTNIVHPRPNVVARSPMSDASLQIEVNLEGCSNDGSGDFDVGRSMHDAGNSSDTQTD